MSEERSLYHLSRRQMGLIVRALSDRAAVLDAEGDAGKAHECREAIMGFMSGYFAVDFSTGDARVCDVALQTVAFDLRRDAKSADCDAELARMHEAQARDIDFTIDRIRTIGKRLRARKEG